LLHGRLMVESEVAGARKVAVVNQTLAAKWFGKEDPIGRQITVKHLGTIPSPVLANPVFEIVGVIGDMKNAGIQDPVQPEIMVPYTASGWRWARVAATWSAWCSGWGSGWSGSAWRWVWRRVWRLPRCWRANSGESARAIR
jgi:hypothetical protein